MINVYDFCGIPIVVSAAFVMVSFVFTMAPYITGKFGTIEIPKFSDLVTTTLRILGPPFLLLSIGLYFPWIKDARQAGASADAFGLRLKSVQWEHRYHINGPNKDFEGVISYDVECTSPYAIGELLADDAVWFGHGIQYEVAGHVVEPSTEPYNLIVSKSFREGTGQEFGKDVTHIHWRPKILPALTNKDKLKYEVIIKTENTESQVFSKDGSFAGMRTRYPAGKLSMRVIAPEGKIFKLMGHFARDTTGKNIDLAQNHSDPSLESVGRIITWTVADPYPAVTYLVRLAIVDP